MAVPSDGKTTATVSLRAQDFEMWDKTKGDYVVEPGQFDMYVVQYSALLAA